jgi:hypothetical protein
VVPDQHFGLKGAVQMLDALRCKILACRVAHTGGSGIEVTTAGCHSGVCPNGIEIQGNKVFDVGGTGIYFSPLQGGVVPGNIADGALIQVNQIFDFGQTYHDAVGLYAGLCSNTIISFNEVARGGYTGINLGSGVQLNVPDAKENWIYANRVHDVIRVNQDGGGIYLIGGGPGYIQNNYVYNIKHSTAENYDGAYGLDWDTGSRGKWIMTRNVLRDIPNVLDPRYNTGWGNEVAVTRPMSMHYAQCGGECVDALDPDQFIWGSTYSDVVPIKVYRPGTPGPAEEIPGVVPIFTSGCTASAEAQQIMDYAGVGYACMNPQQYPYPFQTTNPQIDPPDAAGCSLPVSSSLPPVCELPVSCYANCDASTMPPVLNIMDFTCFLNRFSAGDSYANCDGSTVDPTLNVQDFSCFLNCFSSGCR